MVARGSLFGLTITAAGLWAQPALACRLALVLAIDVSSSVNADEDALQRQGLANALMDPTVQQAFFASRDPVALHVFEWSGRQDQVTLIPDWALIETPDDLAVVATTIALSPRSRTDMPTAMGHAMGYAATLLQQAPNCATHTIDIAGDGQNNDGFSPALAYGAFPFDGVIVNALVVATGDAPPASLVAYFETEVIHGPGAFIEVARGFEDYEGTMKRKLLRELAVQILGSGPAHPQSAG